MSIDAQKRKDSLKALVNIIALEGVLLFAVVAFYLSTSSLTYLVGGIVATQLIFVPIFIRWVRDHAPALKSQPGEDR